MQVYTEYMLCLSDRVDPFGGLLRVFRCQPEISTEMLHGLHYFILTKSLLGFNPGIITFKNKKH